MKTSVLQENLLRALARVTRTVSIKAQLPIMQNILLSSEEGRLRVVATNLETTEVVWVGAKTEKEGGICVSSRLFTEFVTSLPQEAVQLIVQEGSLHVACGGFRATIPGVSAGEFPPVATVNPKTKTVLDKEKIVDALSLVTFAASTDEGRPLLTGVKIKQHDGPTTLAATDGYRLSVKHLAHVTSEDLDLVVPARALLEVSKVSLEEKDVKQIGMIKPGNGQLVFVVGDTEVHTRLIDGEYPNFEKIIPSSHNTRVLLDKEKLSCAVRSAAVFARENANIIKFHIENQTVTVSANTPQVGENQVDVEAKVDGEGGDIAFNSRFLLEFLANYKEEEVLFEMTGSLNSGVFRPVKDDSFLHIIMPVRVSSG